MLCCVVFRLDRIGSDSIASEAFLESHEINGSSSILCRSQRKKDEELPLLMSIFMGLQHAMAMVGGLITPPLVVFKFTVCGFAEGFCPDLVQVSTKSKYKYKWRRCDVIWYHAFVLECCYVV